MDGDAWSKCYDRAFANGRKDGFLDAISELWDMAHEAFEAGDGSRESLIHNLTRELRGRYEAVEARHSRVQADARARFAEQS